MEWAPVPGTVLLGKYRIESVLGRGGMGIVLRVTHLHLGEELALKILSPEAAGGPDVHARFLREAQFAVRLRGEHVTRVSDVGILPEGAPYIVMEYLRGIDLSGELERRRTLPPGDIVDYVLQACEALAEAHALGIVHRDIKPSNLFLTSRPDGTPLVKVLDFGISKAPVSSGVLTRTEAVMGTPGYMSPEQMKAARDVDARTDIWALGIVLYECLHGRRPFDAESFSAAVLRAATEPPPMAPWIPRGLQAAVLRCLEKDRAARFPSAAELAVALSPFARDRRAAAIIVERTTAMLRGSSSAAVVGTRFGHAPDTTTLSGSAGVVRSRSPRPWYAMGGAVFVVGTIAVVSAVIPSGSSRSDDANAGLAVRDAASANDLVATHDKANAAFDSPSVIDARSAITTLDAGVAGPKESALPEGPAVSSAPVGSSGPAVSSAPDRADHVLDLKGAKCAELEVHKDWQGLTTCASQLAAMGAKTKAEEFRVKAVKENASSRVAA
jgi:serine/threonine-protein kinase